MSYQLITKYQSANAGYDPHYSHGGNNPKLIVIHHWGQDGQSFDGVCSWLCRHNGDSSAHFVVEAGKVAQLMPVTDCAWHAGVRSVNCTSIGIECRPECTDGDFQTVVELVADLFKKYGVMPVKGHRDFMATACPGRWYPRLAELKKKAEVMARMTSSASSGGTTKPSVKPAAKPVKKRTTAEAIKAAQAWLGVEADGIWGPVTNAAVTKVFQRCIGAVVDGIPGPETKSKLSSVNLQIGSTGELVKTYQALCAKFGFWDNYIDGTFGETARNSTITYQKACHLDVDGIAGKETIFSMLTK